MKELRHILLVEDDPDITLLATIGLEEVGGYKVSVASSGEEALAMVEGAKPDLLLLDYRMPGMNGGELFKALRDAPATAALPVIFMTASVMPAQVEKLKALGALDVVPKPFDPVELPSIIDRIWRGANFQG